MKGADCCRWRRVERSPERREKKWPNLSPAMRVVNQKPTTLQRRAADFRPNRAPMGRQVCLLEPTTIGRSEGGILIRRLQIRRLPALCPPLGCRCPGANSRLANLRKDQYGTREKAASSPSGRERASAEHKCPVWSLPRVSSARRTEGKEGRRSSAEIWRVKNVQMAEDALATYPRRRRSAVRPPLLGARAVGEIWCLRAALPRPYLLSRPCCSGLRPSSWSWARLETCEHWRGALVLQQKAELTSSSSAPSSTARPLSDPREAAHLFSRPSRNSTG